MSLPINIFFLSMEIIFNNQDKKIETEREEYFWSKILAVVFLNSIREYYKIFVVFYPSTIVKRLSSLNIFILKPILEYSFQTQQ